MKLRNLAMKNSAQRVPEPSFSWRCWWDEGLTRSPPRRACAWCRSACWEHKASKRDISIAANRPTLNCQPVGSGDSLLNEKSDRSPSAHKTPGIICCNAWDSPSNHLGFPTEQTLERINPTQSSTIQAQAMPNYWDRGSRPGSRCNRSSKSHTSFRLR